MLETTSGGVAITSLASASISSPGVGSISSLLLSARPRVPDAESSSRMTRAKSLSCPPGPPEGLQSDGPDHLKRESLWPARAPHRWSGTCPSIRK
jgi:hypothetical protein